MIIYKDIISGDEMFTDSYEREKFKLVDDFYYELEGRVKTETTDISDALIGGNASAEGGGDEGAEASGQTGCNIVIDNRLEETAFNQKSFKIYIKDYIAKIVEHIKENNPERLEAFKKKAQNFMKVTIIANFKDWQFFTGESQDPLGMVGFMNYRKDGRTPYMLFLKDGLLEEKA